MSVLSLESEELIEVSAQNKSVVSSLPKTTLLLPVVIISPGEVLLPALSPRQTLFYPVEMSLPAARPIS